jgi:cholesterol transport system auxiliary component
MMRRGGGLFRTGSKFLVPAALALALAACGGGGPPSTIVDLPAAKPPKARPLGAQIRIAQPAATADLDNDHVLVRDTPLTLATLSGVRWPDTLPSLLRSRLVQSFQNAGLARYLAGGGATADYELDLDIRAFELEAQTSSVRIDIAVRIVSLASGRIAAVDIFTLRAPVASTDPAIVIAALDQAASTVMKRIVAFTAKAL